MPDCLKLLRIILLACVAASCTPDKTPDTNADGTMETAGRWELVPDWPQLPAGVIFTVSGVAVDSRGNVITVHRAGREFGEAGLADTTVLREPVILVFEARTGRLLHSWGEKTFLIPHSVTVDRDDNVWVADVGRQQILKFSSRGELLLTVGEWMVAGSGPLHFNLPTDVAVYDDGSFVVSDGYRNSRIVKFDAQGVYEREWGSNGAEPGQFDIPHGLAIDTAGNIYVADRENARVQVFDASGRFSRQWPSHSGVGPVGDVAVSNSGRVYVAQWDVPEALVVLDSALHTTTSIPFDSLAKPFAHAVAIDGDSVVYFADTDGRRLLKFVRR